MNHYKIIKANERLLLIGFNIISCIVATAKYLKYSKYLKQNKVLENTERGKSCYVLVGGLSVKDIDLEHIKKYDIITANNYFQTDDYLNFRPKYHVIVDKNFWSNEKNESDLARKVLDSTTVFLNLKGTQPNSKRNYRYILPMYRVLNDSIGVDLSKPCSNFSTVTLTCIQLAIFLGYQTINIVGFDFPAGPLPHYYEESDFEKMARLSDSRVVDEYEYCSWYWQYTNCHHESYKLAHYAKSRNVKIYNLSPISYIRAFPYKNFYES